MNAFCTVKYNQRTALVSVFILKQFFIVGIDRIVTGLAIK